MPKTISIRQSLLRSQVIVILLLGGSIMATTFLGARRAVQDMSDSVIRRAMDQAESGLRAFFDPVEGGLSAAEAWGEAGMLDLADPTMLQDLFVPLLRRYPQVSSMMIANDQGQEYLLLQQGERWQARLTDRRRWEGRSRILEWTSSEPEPRESFQELQYDPRRRPWFEGALELVDDGDPTTKGIYWTDPYVFFTTEELGMTAALPYELDGERWVVGFDVLLEDLSAFTQELEVSENGSVTVMTSDGRLIALPQGRGLAPDEDTRGWVLKRPQELNNPRVDEASRAFADRPASELGSPVRFFSDGEAWWGQLRRFDLSPERFLVIVVMLPGSDLVGERNLVRLWILLVTLAALGGAIWHAAVQARRFSEPIEDLVKESERIQQGDLAPGVEVETGFAEVERLAVAHDHMRRGLRSLLKLERDLQLAKQIQQSTFPQVLPSLKGFELEGWSQPADETGGDTYDVIGYDGGNGSRALVEDRADYAVLLLADATGHGIGPALSVTQIRAMLRMAVRMDLELPRIAQYLNEQLFADLPKNRFITAWLGELDPRHHFLTVFSAGQGPLLHYSAARGDVSLANANAPPFGVLPHLAVSDPTRIEMGSGDIYAVFSDGFFEAVNSEGEEFGKERVARVVAERSSAGAADILLALRAAVNQFTRDSPPDDDRTALIVKRTG